MTDSSFGANGSDRLEPLYRQVRSALQEMVEGMEYGPGDRIPSERELAGHLGVSRMTVRRAVEDLTRLGLLERRSTSGTFVRAPLVVRTAGATAQSLSQMVRAAGGAPGSRLLSFETKPAARQVAERLRVGVGEPVVLVRRLRLINGEPFTFESSSLPRALVPGLAAADLVDGSLYDLLRERYGLSVDTADETIGLSRATAEEADLLGLEPDAPVLLMRAVIADPSGRPIEYLVSVNHPDRVAFRVVGRL